MMEKLGRGSELIQQACREQGLPSPKWQSEKSSDVTLTLYSAAQGTKQGLSMDQVGTKSGLSAEERIILELCSTPHSISQLLGSFGRSNRTKFREQYVNPLLQGELLAMTMPEKPKSPNQKYRTTERGQRMLEAVPIGHNIRQIAGA